MFNVLITVFVIFGMIVGAGFASGNEIVVYFSRFGNISYVYIIIASILLFIALLFLMMHGKNIAKRIENSKFLILMTIIISVVFSSSMYAGIDNLLAYFPKFWHVFLMLFVLLLCLFVTIKGIGGLEKFNLFLMPVLAILFLICLCFAAGNSTNFIITNEHAFAGVIFSPLYVALNTSMSVFVLAKQGEKLSKKQAIFACLFSVLLLSFFLLFGNYVLLKNPESFVSEMPILFIVKDNFCVFIFEFFVILVGCFSTLISLCFTLKNSFKKILKNNYFGIFLSVFLPYFICGVGFSRIISFFYPICSVLGIFILLFAIFSFKQTDEIIHPKSKNTQDGS